MLERIKSTVSFIQDKTKFQPEVGIILGTGLGGLVKEIKIEHTLDYEDIKGFPVSTVEGHHGRLIFGELGGKKIVAMQGRFHYYEGHDIETVTLPIHLLHKLGVKYIIITNAAGSARMSMPPGSLMAINGYADCTVRESLIKPQVVRDGSSKLLISVDEASKRVKVELKKGVYCWTQGPGYETPAEVEYIRNLGGDAVGMSTVPELQASEQLGIEAIGISTITNYAAGILDQPLTHNEVIETANRTKNDFAKLIGATIENICELL